MQLNTLEKLYLILRDGNKAQFGGELQMDEAVVDRLVAETMANPQVKAQVLEKMIRMRDPQGVYAQGGCIDTTREYPKSVSRDHCELVLPRV